MTLFVGYTVFHPDPGKWDEMECRVCNTKCVVERDREGPTSYVSAMAGSKRKHDCFWCPYHEAEWHEHALKLKREIEDTVSKKIKAIMQEELDELLSESLDKKKPEQFVWPDKPECDCGGELKNGKCLNCGRGDMW